MPRNGSGVYVAPSNNWNPAVAAAEASASDWNDILEDVETALTGSIAADGQTVLSARINFAAGLSSFAGSVSGVSYSFAGDPNTGIYAPAADKVGIVAGGTEVLRVESALLNPITNNTVDLGSSSVKFKDGFFAGALTVATLTGVANQTTENIRAIDSTGVVVKSASGNDIVILGGSDTNNAQFQGSITTGSPIGTTYGGTGANYANSAAIFAGIKQPATDTATGVVEKATVAEQIAETADKYPDAALLKHHPGIAKAWGSYKNLTSFATYDTYNITSIADTGVGIATVTIANDMASANYTVLVAGDRNDAGAEGGHLSPRTRAAGSFVIRSYGSGAAANTLSDWDYISFAVYGTLA